MDKGSGNSMAEKSGGATRVYVVQWNQADAGVDEFVTYVYVEEVSDPDNYVVKKIANGCLAIWEETTC